MSPVKGGSMETVAIVIEADEARLIGQLFGSGVGSKVLGLLDRTFADQLSYTQGDTHHTAFREGQRSVIQFIENAAKAVKAEAGHEQVS